MGAAQRTPTGLTVAMLAMAVACAPSDVGEKSSRSGAADRADERARMVEQQIASGPNGVSDPVVLAAMRAVPRHAFVPESAQRQAYDDTPLSIGHGQTISQPYIVGAMTELLGLAPGDRVLEIGTGSGYQAAVLAEITDGVYTIEIVPALAERAARTLREQGYGRVRVRCGDGYLGWPEAAPFDAIILTAAPEEIPPPLWDQLRPGGRIVAPVGEQGAAQELVVGEIDASGERRTRRVMLVRFVPLTRNEGG